MLFNSEQNFVKSFQSKFKNVAQNQKTIYSFSRETKNVSLIQITNRIEFKTEAKTSWKENEIEQRNENTTKFQGRGFFVCLIRCGGVCS